MIDYIVYCEDCQKALYCAKNGSMVEANGRIHVEDTNHTVVVGYEITPDNINEDGS